MYTFQRQRKIMPSTWEGVEIDKVNRIPEGGIDGLKIYELNTTASTSSNKQELLKDGRKWKKVMGMCVTQTVKDPTDVKIYSVNIELNMVQSILRSSRKEKMDD